MNRIALVMSVLFCFQIAQKPLLSQVTAPPFTITLEEVTYSDWPGIHSFALGEWDGRWLIMTGRTGGLHGFLPPTPFPIIDANKQIHLFDPETGDYLSANMFTLPESVQDQLQSTNAQFFQRGKYLYIIGGYGHQQATDSMVTYPSLLAVDLEMMSNLIDANESVAPAIRSLADTLFEVSGGEIGLIGDTIYLFGGHIFAGEYSKPAGPQFYQKYTDALKKFTLTDDGETILIHDISVIKDTTVFHRRDLNFEQILLPGEEEALAAFSGVFQYEADWVWFSPVYVTSDGYSEDEAFYQKLNHYTCPVMSIYDSVSQNYYATLFGGIGQYYYDEDDDTIKQDLNVPFVNDISTIIKYADGSTEQYPQPIQFDALLGSNAEFILNNSIPHYNNRVIKLHDINGSVLAGYIYGGIDALIPNFTPSTASNRLFKVWINYTAPVAIQNVSINDISIYPNPVSGEIIISNSSLKNIEQIQIINQLGETMPLLQAKCMAGSSITIDVSVFAPGLYIVKMFGEDNVLTKQLIKL